MHTVPELFRRHSRNPILHQGNWPYQVNSVFNPAATMVDFGVPGGDSSMARTVSLPAAIATRLVLAGEIDRKGVLAPVTPDIYRPVLAELESLDIVCKEQHTRT